MSCPALVLVCEKCRVECSAAFMSNNRDGCTSKRNDLPCAKLREHRDCQLQSSPSVCFWHRHLHSMTQSVFCFFYFFFKDNSSISITQTVLSGCGGCFWIWVWLLSFMLQIQRGKQCLLFRKATLPFWFIRHYIWTCLYLHYVHVAFTENMKINKSQKNALHKFGLRARHKERTITLASRNELSKYLLLHGLVHQLITMRRKKQLHWDQRTVVTYWTTPCCRRSQIKTSV